MTAPHPLSQRTHEVYERNAERFHAERPRVLFERGWLAKFKELLPSAGRILDVGCGSAVPMAAHFLEAGYRVTGIDASSAMIALARRHFPGGDWRHQDMRRMNVPETYDGLFSWDAFFHLTRDEQRAVLPAFAARIAPGGALMLTVGDHDGEVIGRVGDDPVYHASLSPEEYRTILDRLGFEIVDFVLEDPTCAGHSVLLAQRRAVG